MMPPTEKTDRSEVCKYLEWIVENFGERPNSANPLTCLQIWRRWGHKNGAIACSSHHQEELPIGLEPMTSNSRLLYQLSYRGIVSGM